MFEDIYIELTDAAKCLRVPHEACLVLIREGALRAEQRPGGWFVSAVDVAEIRKNWDRFPIEHNPSWTN